MYWAYEMNVRNCECCHGTYATGKDYGNYWCVLPLAKETKGLCASCNPSNKKWFNKKMQCHKERKCCMNQT